jgi:hypothetical protein
MIGVWQEIGEVYFGQSFLQEGVEWESINNPGDQLISQLSGTRYLVVFQARAFSPPPTC